jgi:hypothetical protein
MTTGTLVTVTGTLATGEPLALSGRILGQNAVAMIISVAADRSITLRRDAASMTPDQWRYGKLPVEVRPGDFAEKLGDLERRTRP